MKAFVSSMIAASAAAFNSTDLQFLNYVAEHSKSYDTVEEFNYRMANWIKTHEWILEETAKGLNYKLGHNKFSDWSRAEYTNMLGYKPLDREGFVT